MANVALLYRLFWKARSQAFSSIAPWRSALKECSIMWEPNWTSTQLTLLFFDVCLSSSTRFYANFWNVLLKRGICCSLNRWFVESPRYSESTCSLNVLDSSCLKASERWIGWIFSIQMKHHKPIVIIIIDTRLIIRVRYIIRLYNI